MVYQKIHPAQLSVLNSLRYVESARFSELMHPTGLQSEDFKFHIQKLVKLAYITKLPNGRYQLTPTGKGLANAMDQTSQAIRRQPKVSVLLVVRQPDDERAGEPKYLFQKRLRNPFLAYGVV